MRATRDHLAGDSGTAAERRSRLARLRGGLSTMMGATVALALLLALGVWFYRLGARDAENVPIIRASVEPTKTRPEEPGGTVAPFQEITSYGVAENGEQPSGQATLAPPPPQPRDEDVAMGALAPAPAERPGEPAPGMGPAEGQIVPFAEDAANEVPEVAAARGTTRDRTIGTQSAAMSIDKSADPSVPINSAEAGDQRVGSAAQAEAEAEEIAALVRQATLEVATAQKTGSDDPANGSSGGVPMPPKRPADLHARIEASVRSAEGSRADLTRRAAESRVQIQLAAEADEQVVRARWRRIAESNADILHDRELAVQTVVSGGETVYRLRVGPFAGMSEARAVCQALKARGQDCVVARNG